MQDLNICELGEQDERFDMFYRTYRKHSANIAQT